MNTNLTVAQADANTADNATTVAKIKSLYPKMTAGQKQLADYIIHNTSSAINQSISALMNQTDLKSEASVVKFYRLLGFDSFQSFKISLAQDLAGRTFYHNNSNITLDDSLAEVKKKVFSGAASSILQNNEKGTDECIAAQEMLIRAGRIIIVGLGASSAICQYAHFRFTEMGLNCIYNADHHMTAAVVTHPQPDDVLFSISQSGETADVYKISEKAHANSIPIILLTGNPDSSIGRLAKVVISTESQEKNLLTDALNSRIIQFCFIDALFSMISISNSDRILPNLQRTRNTFKKYKL